MRYSKQISTGLLIEGQSGGSPDNQTHLQTLVDNAVNWGIPVDDIETGYCSDAELKVMLDASDDALDVADPMRKWLREIKATDKDLPRYLEDHIKDDHDGVASNEFLQVRYDNKKTLRATKP